MSKIKLVNISKEHYKKHSHVFWLTGLSGAGKTTLAKKCSELLIRSNISSIVIDGDELRSGINSDLGFSDADRNENIRRAAEICKLFMGSHQVVLASLISPLNVFRENAKKIIGATNFSLIYINCSIEECEKRDVKGLYLQQRQKTITNLTGIGSAFEEPVSPDLIINTQIQSVDECVQQLINFIKLKLEN